jgi:hypothetical protein
VVGCCAYPCLLLLLLLLLLRAAAWWHPNWLMVLLL